MSFEYEDLTISIMDDGKIKITRKSGEAFTPLAIPGGPEEKAMAIGKGLINRRDIVDLDDFTGRFSEWLSKSSSSIPDVNESKIDQPSMESANTTNIHSLNDLIGKNISVITTGPKGPTSTKGILVNEDKDFVIVDVAKGGLFGGKDKKKIVFYSKQSILGVQFED